MDAKNTRRSRRRHKKSKKDEEVEKDEKDDKFDKKSDLKAKSNSRPEEIEDHEDTVSNQSEDKPKRRSQDEKDSVDSKSEGSVEDEGEEEKKGNGLNSKMVSFLSSISTLKRRMTTKPPMLLPPSMYALISSKAKLGIRQPLADPTLARLMDELHSPVLRLESLFLMGVWIEGIREGLANHNGRRGIPPVSRPKVVLHVVDRTTGKYLKRSSINKEISEEEEEELINSSSSSSDLPLPPSFSPSSHIPPLITKDSQNLSPIAGSGELVPFWGETLVVCEKYQELVKKSSLLLFEIQPQIAWGFLHPVSLDGEVMVSHKRRWIIKEDEDDELDTEEEEKPLFITSEKQRKKLFHHSASPLKLQLFWWNPESFPIGGQSHAYNVTMRGDQVPPVFVQYLGVNRRNYPATLDIKIGPVSGQKKKKKHKRGESTSSSSFDRKIGFEEGEDEDGVISGDENEEEKRGSFETSNNNISKIQQFFHLSPLQRKLRRKPKSACRPPNKVLHNRLDVGRLGSSCVRFRFL